MTYIFRRPSTYIFERSLTVGPPRNSGVSSVGLSDPDGDGIYTGVAGGIQGAVVEKGEYKVAIEQGTIEGRRGSSTVYGPLVFGPQTIDLQSDRTISTTVDFRDQGGANTGEGGGDNASDDQYADDGSNADGGNTTVTGGGSGDSASGGNNSGGGIPSTVADVLPDTGGAALLPAAGIGVVLIGGGLLARRILR